MKEKIKNRFLQYIAFDTQSSEESNSVPSTKKQRILGKFLVDELQEIGITNAFLDEYGYVYGFLPANTNTALTIGLIAHQDTATELTGSGYQTTNYH